MPAMPSARRLARRSVRLLMRMGLPKAQARVLVSDIAMDVYNQLAERECTELSWLLRVAGEALTWGVEVPPAENAIPGGSNDPDQS